MDRNIKDEGEQYWKEDEKTDVKKKKKKNKNKKIENKKQARREQNTENLTLSWDKFVSTDRTVNKMKGTVKDILPSPMEERWTRCVTDEHVSSSSGPRGAN